jgi:hypothetical protein
MRKNCVDTRGAEIKGRLIERYMVGVAIQERYDAHMRIPRQYGPTFENKSVSDLTELIDRLG